MRRLGAAIAISLVLLETANAAPAARFVGPDEVRQSGCAMIDDTVRVRLGSFALRIPVDELRRMKIRSDEPCAQAYIADDILIETPADFRTGMLYRAKTIRADDATRIATTLRAYANDPDCITVDGIRRCQISDTAGTTFVFGTNLDPIPGLQLPVHARCTTRGADAEICRIQNLSTDGFQYESALGVPVTASTLGRATRFALETWARLQNRN